MVDLNMKILVADDFSTMRKIIKNSIKEMGFNNFEEAENGEQALALLKKGNFDFLVTDWNMPVMSGLELVNNIRDDPELKGLPILMVTAEAEKDKIVMAVKAGVNNYIVKPFSKETMKKKVELLFPQ